MATITTSQFLDNGTTRTAGETWTMSANATLTVRTDTRWHSNSPASMTGSIGGVTINLPGGGGFAVEGRNVRWLKFDSGIGNVPAIGTTITQGGVSGYLLGVWADLTSAPTAVGSLMPVTGFMKFREVTGGQFIAGGALTGIAANPLATNGSGAGADAPGWIEVVFDQGSTFSNTANDLGDGFVTQGEWFYLDDTTGSPGQLLQVPTNGGGAASDISGIQIETAAGSGVFEWWPCTITASFTTAGLTTDIRAKVVNYVSNGQLRIGFNGTSNVGYTPPAGCKVRIPNILMRQCTTGARATNAAPSTNNNTRPRFSGIQKLTFSKTYFSWYIFPPATSPYVSLVDCAFEGYMQLTNTILPLVMTRCVLGYCTTTNNGSPLSLTNIYSSATFTDVTVYNQNAGGIPVSCTWLANCTFANLKALCGGATRAAGVTISWSGQNSNCTFTNFKSYGGHPQFSNITGLTVTDFDYIESLAGATSATNANAYFMYFSSCVNVLVDRMTWGMNGALANCHPYCNSGMFYLTTGNRNVKIRNLGTANAPLTVGATSTTWPRHLGQCQTNVGFSGISNQIKLQRLFVDNIRTFSSPVTTDSTTTNVLFEQISTGTAQALSFGGFDIVAKGIRCPGGVAALFQNPTSGVFYTDVFTSDTAGIISFHASRASDVQAPYVTSSITAGSSSLWTSSGMLLRAVGDYFMYETPYYTKGYTAFQNVAPTFNGTNSGNHLMQYQIDTGSGFGTLKTLNAANLSAETISPTTGFKMRFKISCTTAATNNTFTYVTIPMTTTLVAQRGDLYELDVSSLTFTNLVAGSEVRCYTGSDPATAVEISGTESSGTSFSFTHSAGGSVGFIRIFALGYQPFNYDPYTYAASDTTLLVQQTIDRNYVNP